VLAVGDYLLWNWSLGANHEVVALVSGMTLIPLLIALAWLLLVAVARLVGRVAQRPRYGSAVRSRGAGGAGGRGRRGTRVGVAAGSTLAATGPAGPDDTTAGRAVSSSSKLAA
jgi:hypothetical protein